MGVIEPWRNNELLGILMRNLKRYPITPDEIETALLKEAKTMQAEERIGDMRPLLFRAAAKIVMRVGFVTYDLTK